MFHQRIVHKISNRGETLLPGANPCTKIYFFLIFFQGDFSGNLFCRFDRRRCDTIVYGTIGHKALKTTYVTRHTRHESLN